MPIQLLDQRYLSWVGLDVRTKLIDLVHHGAIFKQSLFISMCVADLLFFNPYIIARLPPWGCCGLCRCHDGG